jgi:hypothetical protein
MIGIKNMRPSRPRSFLIIPLFFGQINVKFYRNALFSERYGHAPTLRVGPILFTWRKWEKVE